MPKEGFYTRVERNGATCAIKVNGYIDKKREIGYYVKKHELWADDWYAVDLRVGQSVATASTLSEVKAKVRERFIQLEEIRARENHKELHDAFAREIVEAEQAEGGQEE